MPNDMRFKLAFLVAASLAISIASSAADTETRSVSVNVDPDEKGITIPADFTGVSLETAALHQSRPYLANNTGLKNILGVLQGKCTVRFGGSTSDTLAPNDGEIKSGIEFAKTICKGQPLVWGVASKPIRPNTTVAEQGATDAKNVATVAAALGGVSGLVVQIGNEPNLYQSHSFEDWYERWTPIRTIISDAVPGVSYAGPDIATDRIRPPAPFTKSFVANMGPFSSMLTMHCYGTNQTGQLYRDAVSAINAACLHEAADVADDPRVRAWKSRGRTLRLVEAGNYRANGTEGESLAGGIYDLKIMTAYAQAGWAGINFHCGYCSSTGSGNYSPVRSQDGITYEPTSTLYAMVAFQSLVGGKIVPSTGLGQWETLASVKGAKTTVLVLNQDLRKPMRVKITSTRPFTTASANVLSGADYADTAITFGGSAISSNGAFSPVTSQLKTASDGSVTMTLCASCAGVVTLQ